MQGHHVVYLKAYPAAVSAAIVITSKNLQTNTLPSLPVNRSVKLRQRCNSVPALEHHRP